MVLYQPAKAATELPVVDYAQRHAGAAARAAIAREIHKAARDTGFFYVKNHGVERSVVDGLMTNAVRLLDLPLAQKQRLQKKSGFRGWEGLEAQVLDPGSPPDLRIVELRARSGTTIASGAGSQFPDDLPGFAKP